MVEIAGGIILAVVILGAAIITIIAVPYIISGLLVIICGPFVGIAVIIEWSWKKLKAVFRGAP